MRISTKGKYGLKAVVSIAQAMETERCVSIKTIAERNGLSENYLEHIIAALKKAGIVKSVRGASGGYFLARPPFELSVGEVLRALEGPLSPADCVLDPTDSCGDADCSICATKGLWVMLHRKINEFVDSITIADLAADESLIHAL